MHIGFSENRNNNHHNHNNDNSNSNCDNDISSLNDNQSTSNNNKMISKINTSIKDNIDNSKLNNHNSSKNNNNGNNTGNTGSHTQHTVNASRLSGYYDGLLLRFETVQEKHVTFKLTSLSHKKYKPSNFGSVAKAEDPGDLGSASGIANSEEI